MEEQKTGGRWMTEKMGRLCEIAPPLRVFLAPSLKENERSLQNMEIISRKEMAKWFQKKYTVEDRNFAEGEVGKKDELILPKGLYSPTSICEIVRVWIILVEQKCVLL